MRPGNKYVEMSKATQEYRARLRLPAASADVATSSVATSRRPNRPANSNIGLDADQYRIVMDGICYDTRTFCRKHKQPFPSFQALFDHKKNSIDHIICEICAIEFETDEGFHTHHLQLHAAQQRLECPGCEVVFTRLGSLMSHLETGMCTSITTQMDFVRRKTINEANTDGFEVIRQAGQRTHVGSSDMRTINSRPDLNASSAVQELQKKGATPKTTIPATTTHDFGACIENTWRAESVSPKHPSLLANVESISEDLIDLNTPSATLNAPWDYTSATSLGIGGMSAKEQSLPVSLQASHAPAEHFSDTVIRHTSQDKILLGQGRQNLATASNALTSSFARALPDALSGETLSPKKSKIHTAVPNKVATVWGKVDPPPAPVWCEPSAKTWGAPGTSKRIFPDAKPAPLKPADPTVQSSSKTEDIQAPEGTKLPEHHPDAKEFDVRKYYISILGKYKCPHGNCAKSFHSATGFKQHLKSLAHIATGVKLQCTLCLRFFGSATALVQHCESEGVRCNIRKTARYDASIENMTFKTATVAGLHDDKTVKYAVNPEMLRITDVYAANAAAIRASDRRKEEYWLKNDKNW